MDLCTAGFQCRSRSDWKIIHKVVLSLGKSSWQVYCLFGAASADKVGMSLLILVGPAVDV